MNLTKEINWKYFTLNALLGYIIAWLYFFTTLSIFQKILGKNKGTAINYGLSWIVWFISFKALHTLNPDGNFSQL